jgi:hypothetical protein
MHGASPAVAAAFEAGLASLPGQVMASYYEIAHSMSSPALRRILEGFMASSTIISSPLAKHHYSVGKAEGIAEGKAEGIAEGKAEGIAEGEAEAILLVLKSRDIPVTKEQEDRITSCADQRQLKAWLGRVGTIASADELFD